MFAKCINNDNWFGTIDAEYKVLSEGVKTLKDITCDEDNYTYSFYLVVDDCGEFVKISKDKFSK